MFTDEEIRREAVIYSLGDRSIFQRLGFRRIDYGEYLPSYMAVAEEYLRYYRNSKHIISIFKNDRLKLRLYIESVSYGPTFGGLVTATRYIDNSFWNYPNLENFLRNYPSKFMSNDADRQTD